MYDHNPYAKIFKTASKRARADSASIQSLTIFNQSAGNARRHNCPTADEVAAILLGDAADAPSDRDVVLQLHNGKLCRISALHPAYFLLAYSLLFYMAKTTFVLDLSGFSHSFLNHISIQLEHISRPHLTLTWT